jgi:hypothetical protein
VISPAPKQFFTDLTEQFSTSYGKTNKQNKKQDRHNNPELKKKLQEKSQAVILSCTTEQ